MSSLSSLYIKKEVLETLLKVVNQKGEKGVDITISINEESNQYLTQLMAKQGIANNDERFWFAQLYGMSDNITFNLAKAGCPVSKYLPFGPIRDVIPYLMRRAQENSSVSGQTGRELGLIRKELKRRGA